MPEHSLKATPFRTLHSAFDCNSLLSFTEIRAVSESVLMVVVKFTFVIAAGFSIAGVLLLAIVSFQVPVFHTPSEPKASMQYIIVGDVLLVVIKVEGVVSILFLESSLLQNGSPSRSN